MDGEENPLDFLRDPVWGVGHVIWDAGVMIAGLVTDDGEVAEKDLKDLAVDAVASVVPLFRSGASKISKSASNAKKKPKGKYACTAKKGMVDSRGGKACCGWVTGVGVHQSKTVTREHAKKMLETIPLGVVRQNI